MRDACMNEIESNLRILRKKVGLSATALTLLRSGSLQVTTLGNYRENNITSQLLLQLQLVYCINNGPTTGSLCSNFLSKSAIVYC